MNDVSQIKNHLNGEGRLKQWPSKRPLQQVALDYLSAKFEAERLTANMDG